MPSIFKLAAIEYPFISIDPEIMVGSPCIKGTRLPVYMILDAVEYHGSLEKVLKSYPGITIKQIEHAIGFAKFVIENLTSEE